MLILLYNYLFNKHFPLSVTFALHILNRFHMIKRMINRAQTLASPGEPSLFEDHASQVIARFRHAVAAVVESVPAEGRRSSDLADALGVDMNLAWRIGHLLGDTDPYSAARYVPGAPGFKTFLRAARRRDVSKGLIAAAQAAFGSFSELVQTHAGSRKAFNMLLAAHAQEDRVRADFEHRRQMFEGSSYVLGVQARTVLRLDILAPSTVPMMLDCATVRGFIDLRRLRPNVPWRVSQACSVDDAGDARVEFVREPLTQSEHRQGAVEGAPLLAEFCSRPLPECRRVEAPHGAIEYELVEGAVGNTGLLTCVTGELIREIEPRYRTEDYSVNAQMFPLRTPSELAIFDVLMHRELFGRRTKPELFVYSDMFSDPVAPRYRDCDLLPVQEKVEYLGMGPDVLATSDVPRYVELARFTLKRCGWDAAKFDVYRVQMKYPPIPATMIIEDDLPEQPA